MPWHIGQSAECPASRPYAVIQDADGSVAGCHKTREAAEKQMGALYGSEDGLRAAIGSHSTATDKSSSWDGPGAVAGAPNDPEVLAYMHAWRDPNGDPAAKSTYKFPHHPPRRGSAANITGVNNALSRLPQANIPAADRAGVERHLRRHRRDAGLEENSFDSNWEGRRMVATERRYTPGTVEIRARKELRAIGGYAAVHGRQSRNLGGFVEVIAAGFFNKSRGDGWPDVVARYNHDDNMLLGSTAANTLRLSIDEYGLHYEVDPPQSRIDILELVERGDVRHSSFAFRVFEEDWGATDQGFPLRTLMSGQLVDVAPVVSPAYVDTTAGLRSLAERVGASLEEVRSLAEANELRKFFVNTGSGGKTAPPRTFGPAARAAILEKRPTRV